MSLLLDQHRHLLDVPLALVVGCFFWFEVGAEVREAFVKADARATSAFTPAEREGHWFADLYQLARQRLAGVGVRQVYGGDECTWSDAARFFSYRRDGQTGRFASLIWLESPVAG